MNMKCQLIYGPLTLCPLILLVANLARADDAESSLPQSNSKLELKREDWAPTHYQAYDTKGHFKGPSEVFALLKQLQAIYEPNTDEETNGRKTRVEKLIQAADMNPRLCHREYMENFQRLIHYHSPYRQTIVPYLSHQFVDFMNICEESVIQNLHSNVGGIREDYRKDMIDLAKATAEIEIDGIVLGYAHINEVWIYTINLIEATANFLSRKLGDESDARISKRKFKTLMGTHVLDMCKAWVLATDPTDALRDFDIFLKLSDEEVLWMKYGQLCHYILETKSNLFSRIHRHLKRHVRRNNQNYSRFALCKRLAGFNCFG